MYPINWSQLKFSHCFSHNCWSRYFSPVWNILRAAAECQDICAAAGSRHVSCGKFSADVKAFKGLVLPWLLNQADNKIFFEKVERDFKVLICKSMNIIFADIETGFYSPGVILITSLCASCETSRKWNKKIKGHCSFNYLSHFVQWFFVPLPTW